MKLMRTPGNIPLGKDGLPQYWREWKPEMRTAYLERNLYAPFKQATGVDLKAEVQKRLEAALFSLRVRLSVAKKTDSPVFRWDAEAKVEQAVRDYLRRKEAPAVRRSGARAAEWPSDDELVRREMAIRRQGVRR